MGPPTLLPDFNELVEEIADGTGEIKHKNETNEAFLGRLKCKKIDVNTIAAEKLSERNLQHNRLHDYIVALFKSTSEIKIVTTNYDNMFEQSIHGSEITNVKVYDAPALPLGNDVKGIVHIHGNVNEPEYMVLTDEDFGNAYLADGYVSRFLVKLIETYTILFIGYSYEDMIVRYLTRAMTKYQKYNRYVLIDKEDARWSELGIQPILYEYSRHDILNDGLQKLGERIKRGLLDWKSSLSLISRHPPQDISARSELEYCLKDINKVRLLVELIDGEEWLWWIDENGFINRLFETDTQLNENDNLWLKWIVEKYVGINDELIKRLFVKHNNQINKQFAICILDTITQRESQFSNVVLKQYLVLLDAYLSKVWILHEMIEILMERKEYSFGWFLFQKCFIFDMILKEELSLTNDKEIVFEHNIPADEYCIGDTWEKYSESFLQNNSLNIVQFGWDYFSKLNFNYKNSALEEKEKEPYSLLWEMNSDDSSLYEKNAITVLGEAVCKASKLLQRKNRQYVKCYIELFIQSESALLRVFGLKILRETDVFSADKNVIFY